MKKIIKILAVIGGIVLLLAVFKLTQYYYEGRITELTEEVRIEKIRASKLEKIADGHYQKLVDDTYTIRELKETIDSLEIAVKTPKIVEKIVIDFVKVEKPVDNVELKESIITVSDSYPSKLSPFVTYNFSYNMFTNETAGTFSFSKIPISIIVSEEPGGVHKADIIAPDFVVVDDFTFKSLPMIKPKPNYFGWLAGAGYYKNLMEQTSGVELTGGLRYKSVYVLGSIQTNSSVGIKTLIEF